MSDIEEISELEAMVAETVPDEKPDRSAIKFSTIGYEIAIVVLDGVTAATVWALTYWWYGVIWFLAGAISFFLHQKNWRTAGNNETQNKNAQTGMVVSVVMMLVMAIAAGVLFVFGIKEAWVEAVIIASVVCAFFWHGFQMAMYVFKDDEWIINDQVARAIANADKRIKIAHAGGKVVAKTEEARKARHEQYKKYGDRGAVDAAIGKITGGGQKPAQRPQEAPKQAVAFAKGAEAVKLEEAPPNAQGRD